MKRVFLFIISGVLCLLLLLIFLLAIRSSDGKPSVRLETHTALSGTADSDGDGVPNWLEEITDSDVLNAESFPYNRDVVRAGQSTDDALLHDGPGDFTEEIIQRFLFDVDDSASVTEAERRQFVDESVAYFLSAVEERGLPDVVLSVDDVVSRGEVLDRFASAIRGFSEVNEPIDVLIFNVFSKDAEAIERARQVRVSCDDTLQMLPRSVPQDVYTLYHSVLERVTYLCEALTIALTSATAENFFYTLRLLSAGAFFENLDSKQSSADGSNAFVLAVEQIVKLLQE